MKHIVKNDTKNIQQAIDSWVAKAKRERKANWEHFSQDRTDKGAYAPTKAALISEQADICCYCERLVDTHSCHVEHFQGKGRYPERMFDYSNLHASCNGSPGTTDHCCGHKRAEQNNPDIPISPLDENCESRFYFTRRGRVTSAKENDQEARETIDILGLNSAKLRGSRRRIMIELEGCQEGMTPDDFKAHVEYRLQPDQNGRFPEFFTTIRHFAG